MLDENFVPVAIQGVRLLDSNPRELKGRIVQVNPGDPSDVPEVGIDGEQGGVGSPRHRCDHAIDHTSGRNACGATAPVDTSCALEVRSHVEPKQLKPQ